MDFDILRFWTNDCSLHYTRVQKSQAFTIDKEL